INRSADMMNVGAFKAAHYLHNRVHFANVAEKLIAKSFARARAFHQPGDVDKLDRGRHDFLRMRKPREDVESCVGHGHHADIRIDRAKWIIFRRRFVRSGDGVKKRRFSDVRQTDNSSAEHAFSVAAVYDRRNASTCTYTLTSLRCLTDTAKCK